MAGEGVVGRDDEWLGRAWKGGMLSGLRRAG